MSQQQERASNMNSDLEKSVDHDNSAADTAMASPQSDTPPPSMKPERKFEFADGGIKAWSCVIGAMFALFVTFGFANSLAVFQSYYQSGPLSSYTASQISWLASVQLFFFFFGGLFTGVLFDMFGPRPLMIAGTLLLVFGFMMWSLSSQYYQFFLSQSVCIGFGSTLIFMPAFTSVTTYFHKKRGMASGLVAGGSSLGGVIFPIVVQRLLGQVGFGWTMRIVGFIVLFCMIISCVLVTSAFPAKGWASRKGRTLFDWRAFKELPYFLVVASGFITFIGFFPPINYTVDYALSYGVDPSLSFYMISIFNASSVFGRTLPAAMADKVGRFNVMFVTSILSTIFILAVWMTAHSTAQIIVFEVLYGFSSGCFISLMIVLIVMVSPDMSKIGQRNGTFMATIAFAVLISLPGSGALITPDSFNNGYGRLQIFSGVIMAGSAVLYFITRMVIAKGKIWVKV